MELAEWAQECRCTNGDTQLKLLLIVIFLLIPLQALGATYYVDNDAADDTGTGAIGDPWKTISKAMTTADAGDTVYFQKGDTWTEDWTNPSNNGSDGLPITFDAYGSGADPVWQPSTTTLNYFGYLNNKDYFTFNNIHFNGAVITAGSGQVFIALNGWSNLTFSNCTFTGASVSAVGHGLSVANGTVITVDSCTFTANYGWGIALDTATYGTITNNTVTNCSKGISAHNGDCSNLIIQGNTVTGAGKYQAGNAIAVPRLQTGDTILIDNNIVSDPEGSEDCYSFSFLDDQTSVAITDNIFTNSDTSKGDVAMVVNMSADAKATVTGNDLSDSKEIGLYIYGGNGATVSRNIIKRAGIDGAGANRVGLMITGADVDANFHYAALNHEVSANIVTGCHRGIKVYGDATYPSSAVQIINNTVYDCKDTSSDGFSFYAHGTGSGTVLKNNILHSPGYYFVRVAATQQSGWDADYNDFYTAGTARWKWGVDADDTTLGQWQSASSGDANSVTSDPLFRNAANDNFRTQSGSPVEDLGICTMYGADSIVTHGADQIVTHDGDSLVTEAGITTIDYAGRTFCVGATCDAGAYAAGSTSGRGSGRGGMGMQLH